MYVSDNSTGYLTVMVSTARGAVPLEGATVNIRANSKESSEILYSLLSDRDGKTPKVSLKAPPIENSEFPNGKEAFFTYNVDVFKDGYVPLYFNNVPVFPSVLSVQPAVMVPLDTEAPYDKERNVDGPSEDLIL